MSEFKKRLEDAAENWASQESEVLDPLQAPLIMNLEVMAFKSGAYFAIDEVLEFLLDARASGGSFSIDCDDLVATLRKRFKGDN